MDKYYEVVAKCGHVGRSRYYEGHIFVRANSRSEAAQIVKVMPRVKTNHQDVILENDEIGITEYTDGVSRMNNNPYFKCRSKSEQNEYWELIKENVYPETQLQMLHRLRENKKYRKEARGSNGKIREPYKYAKLNMLSEIYNNYEMIGV